MEMGYIDIKSSGGGFKLNAKPGLIFYFAITIPLVVAIIGSYVYWDRHNKYAAERETDSAV